MINHTGKYLCSIQWIVLEIPQTEKDIINNWNLEASEVTKKSFKNTSSGPDFKVLVVGPTRIPAFPEISVSHCSALPQSLLHVMYIHGLHTNDSWQMGSNRSASEIKGQHLGTEPKGKEREERGKATCCAEHGCCSSHGGEQNLLEAGFSRLFRS